MLNNFKYILKVWFTTIILSAIFVCVEDKLIFLTTGEFVINSILVVLLTVALGFIFSAPTVVIQFILLNYYLKTHTAIFTSRVYLSVIALVGIFISFKIFDEKFFTTLESFTWPVIYATVMVSAIWFYKLAPAHQETDNEQH